MSVFKVRKSPYYQFDFQIKGFRFSGSTKCRNERDAEEVERQKRAEAERIIKEHTATKRKPLTLQTACERWWDEVGRHGNDPDLKRALEWLWEQIGPQVMLHDITDDIVTQAIEARRACVMKAGRDEKGKQLYRPVSPRTINKTVPSLLSRVMNRARKNWNAIILNPPEWSNHYLPVPKRPIREITPAEDARLDEVESQEYCQLREVAEIMGFRRKELLLQWPQVDFELGIIRIIGKGGVPAILPMPRRVYEILWSLRGNHKLWVFTFVAQRTRVCPITKTKFIRGQRYPMTYFGIGTNRRRKWSKAGVDARLHDTRHTTGMRTLRTTGNLKLAQRLLRHTDIKTTAKFYTDANLNDLREGLEATIGYTESQKKSRDKNFDDVKSQKDKVK